MKRTVTSDQVTIDRWDCCHRHPKDLDSLSFYAHFLFHWEVFIGVYFFLIFFLSRMERREGKTLIILAFRLTQQTPYLDYVELSEYPWKISALTFKKNKYRVTWHCWGSSLPRINAPSPLPKKVSTFAKYKPFENWNPDRKATKTGLLYTDAYEQNRLLVDKSTSNFYK